GPPAAAAPGRGGGAPYGGGGPPPPCRDPAEARVRVHDPRLADPLEQRQVGYRVGVEVAPPELDAVLGGETLGPVCLSLAVADRPNRLAREAASLDQELREEDVLDAEGGRQRLRPGPGPPGQDHGQGSGAPVRLDRGGHRRVDVRADRAGVPGVAVSPYRRLLPPPDPRHRDRDRAFDVEEPELVPADVVERARDVPAPGLAGLA